MMTSKKKQGIYNLLKGIETGEAIAVSVVNEAKYIQHNPQTEEGNEGLADLFKRLSTMSPSVNIVRLFEDGDFVFGQTEYDFSTSNIGFEVFRFEDGQAVEHWDNIQLRQGPNVSGHSMVDGCVDIADHEHTEKNRSIITSYAQTVLIDRKLAQMPKFINESNFVQHNALIADGLAALQNALDFDHQDSLHWKIERCHRVLAEGNFVLCVSEGSIKEVPYAFYDLFRLEHGCIVEQWDTREAIPPKSEWKNDNGKF